MTEPERAALDHIRQVVDSVIGVPAPPEPATIKVPPVILPVPFNSQSAGQGIEDSGLAAGLMLANAYTDQTISLADFSEKSGQAADKPLSFTQIMKALGALDVPVELRSNLKLSDLSLILFSGRPVITPIEQSVLQQAGLVKDGFNGPYFVIVVGMDVKNAFIHEPLQKDGSGQALSVPWPTFYQAWTGAQGYERAVLVPRQQLLRRVRVTSNLLEAYEQPGGADATPAGSVNLGDVFEVTMQRGGWGKIAGDRWIDLSHTVDI